MAQLRCRECGSGVSTTEVVCHSCGEILLDEGATTTAPEPEPPVAVPEPAAAAKPPPVSEPSAMTTDAGATAAAVSSNPRQCPHCGTAVADRAALSCHSCMKSLTAGPAAPARLVLRFGAGEVAVGRGETLPLGRDTLRSPAAGTLAGYDNVSRLHATIGLEPDGRAWIRDERSTNGTWVDGRRLAPGETAGLGTGSTVRLAADVPAEVELPGERRRSR